jgi:heme/copper-type cytochrome/quinol oxidase subunit 3
MNQIDNATFLLLMFLACELFIFVIFVVVYVTLPAVKPIELSKDDRKHIQRAYRDKKSA